MKKWEVRGTEKVFANRMFSVTTKQCFHPEKKVSWDFHVVDTFDWINVIGLTPDNMFVLVKQHRLGTDELSVETPGGVVEPGEDPAECAIREFREETGFEGSGVHLLKRLRVNPAIMGNNISFYLIEGCVRTSPQELDEAEDIEVLTLDVDQVTGMVRDGSISHSIVITGLGLYFLSKHNRFGRVEI
ncbi:MAG TPA: NUDIX hydrolase [Spirochaetota bacterium]|nr:NUDIX hydrolase [Spirochaetota bacterium]